MEINDGYIDHSAMRLMEIIDGATMVGDSEMVDYGGYTLVD